MNSQPNNSRPKIIVVGNEKGGAGKTTFSMHLIVGLIDKGYRVVSIDTDARQKSLTNYIANRQKYNLQNPDAPVEMPKHFHLQESTEQNLAEKEKIEKENFENTLLEAFSLGDIIVIDTPGSHSHLSRLVHSYADLVITPINDSFIDIDVIASIQNDDYLNSKPSIYSEMLWQQKMEKLARDGSSTQWIVARNRLSNIDAHNKRNVHDALKIISKKLAFEIAPGFSERVIFRELFPFGLTLLDLTKANFNKAFSISHIAARQELREFMNFLKL